MVFKKLRKETLWGIQFYWNSLIRGTVCFLLFSAEAQEKVKLLGFGAKYREYLRWESKVFFVSWSMSVGIVNCIMEIRCRGLYPAKLASRKLAGRVSSQCSGSHCSELSLFFWFLSLGNKIIATLYSMQIGGNTWRSRGNIFMAPSPKKDRRFFKAEENYLVKSEGLSVNGAHFLVMCLDPASEWGDSGTTNTNCA